MPSDVHWEAFLDAWYFMASSATFEFVFIFGQLYMPVFLEISEYAESMTFNIAGIHSVSI